jgi:hypothetical protein
MHTFFIFNYEHRLSKALSFKNAKQLAYHKYINQLEFLIIMDEILCYSKKRDLFQDELTSNFATHYDFDARVDKAQMINFIKLHCLEYA